MAQRKLRKDPLCSKAIDSTISASRILQASLRGYKFACNASYLRAMTGLLLFGPGSQHSGYSKDFVLERFH